MWDERSTKGSKKTRGVGVGTKQEGECGAPGRMLGRISHGRQGCPEVGIIGAEVAVLLTQVQMQAKDRA